MPNKFQLATKLTQLLLANYKNTHNEAIYYASYKQFKVTLVTQHYYNIFFYLFINIVVT